MVWFQWINNEKTYFTTRFITFPPLARAELQETGFYDYGWRQYMPDLGRWFGMDKLSETYNSHSPYAYVMNNPAMFFDPDGRDTEMPDWMKTMWAMTPVGTNTSWSNTGTGNGFMNTGFSGSMSGSYTSFYSPMGSTVGYNGTGIYAFGNSGGLGGNSGGYSSSTGGGYIDIPTVYLTGDKSGWGKQAQAQFNAFMNVINENEKAFYEPSFVGYFAEGFRYADKSKLLSGSALTGYAGLQATKYEKLFRYTSKTSSTWASKAGALKGAKVAAIGGKALGLAGVVLTVAEDIRDDKAGVGTGVKVAIGLATTFAYGAFGPVALGYTIVDLAVGFSTGTTLTDRIAAGIENTVIGQ